jgi:DNA-binding ferritin-like protein (Dps family)
MKLSELRHAIREMIVSELVEVSADDVKRQQQYNIELEKTKELMDDLVTEEDLYEMATFYKVKPEAGAEAKQAIAKAQEKFREGSALYNTLDLLKTKGEVDYKELAKVTGKDIATYNNPKSREVLEKDLAAFIDVAAGGKREAGPKEPKEP